MTLELTLRCAQSAACLIAVLAVAGCSESSPVDVPEPEESTLQVDARTEWAFVELGAEAKQVTVADAATSDAWDVAFNATGVMLNGGAAGPGGVQGYCVCANAGATDAAVMAMTPGSELAAFEAVTLADLPASEDAWQSDALDPVIDGWYTYDMTTHVVTADPTQVWMIRGAGDDPEYASFHVTQIADGTQAGANVTIEFAVQSAAGAALGSPQSVVLDGRTAPVYFDFATGAVSDADNWDIQLDGFDLLVNGGVSGSGGAGALLSGSTFAEVTDPSSAMASLYRGDQFGGVFAAHAWYRYNLDDNHTIFPTFDVYLVRRGTQVYKVQIIGYYNTAGDARFVTFRYAPLDGSAS